jgi:hypothetical protein
MKLKKEDRCVDTSVLLRRGNKIPIDKDTETKCGAATEGKAIQRLPIWGSIPYTNTKPRRYCECWEVLALLIEA